MAPMTIPEHIREAARLACEPARGNLKKIADKLEREEWAPLRPDQQVKDG